MQNSQRKNLAANSENVEPDETYGRHYDKQRPTKGRLRFDIGRIYNVRVSSFFDSYMKRGMANGGLARANESCPRVPTRVPMHGPSQSFTTYSACPWVAAVNTAISVVVAHACPPTPYTFQL